MSTNTELEENLITTLQNWRSAMDKTKVLSEEAAWAFGEAKRNEIWKPKYGSFKEWLAEECSITEDWAYKLLGHTKFLSDVCAAIPEVLPVAPLLTERHTRPLRKLKPETAAKVILAAAVKSGGNGVSSKVIRQEVARITHKPLPRQQPPPRQGPETHPILSAMEEWFNTELRNSAYGPGLTPRGVFNGLLEVVRKQVV